MVVLPARGMLLKEIMYRRRAEVLIDFRTTVKERVGHLVVNGTAEPTVHDVDSKAAFRAFQNRIGKITCTDLAV